MKKYIYTLCLALGVGVAANAVTMPNVNFQTKKNFVTTTNEKTNSFISAKEYGKMFNKSESKFREKRNATVEDFYGLWKWDGVDDSALGQGYENGLMEFFPGEEKGVVKVFGLSYMADGFKGGLDAYFEDNSIVIPDQMVWDGSTPDENGNFTGTPDPYQEVWFRNVTVRHITDYEWEVVWPQSPNYDPTRPREDILYRDWSDQPFRFTLTPSGRLRSGENADHDGPNFTDEELKSIWNFAAHNAKNQFSDEDLVVSWLCQYIVGDKVTLFSFDPDQWQNVGTAKLLDPWFSALFNYDAEMEGTEKVEPWDVPLYQDKNKSTRFLLFDPFGPNSPIEGNESEDEGFIVFDIEYPNCVMVEPMVLAGKFNFWNNIDAQNFYCYNKEGIDILYNGSTVAGVLSELRRFRKNASNYDEDTKLVSLYNAQFDLTPITSLLDPWDWYEITQENVPMEGYIQLPMELEINGVESIIDGETAGEPVYFNLQGVRVQNPEKGQILIKRQGNKASKVIVK